MKTAYTWVGAGSFSGQLRSWRVMYALGRVFSVDFGGMSRAGGFRAKAADRCGRQAGGGNPGRDSGRLVAEAGHLDQDRERETRCMP